MFPHNSRMRAAEVRGALRGRRCHSTLFSVVAATASRKSCAVVVSKKVSPSAVTRNRIRRRTYAALRTVPFSGALVLFPKGAVATTPFPELVNDLSSLLSKITRAA